MKKLISTPPLRYIEGMACKDYFHNLDPTSPQFFLIQFVLKNTYIPRVMHRIRNSPALIESAQKMLQNIQNPSTVLESFSDDLAEYLLLYLFLMDHAISSETFIHFNNYLSALRHCGKSLRLRDNLNHCLDKISNSECHSFSTEALDVITLHFLDTPAIISVDAWEYIDYHYNSEENPSFWKRAFLLVAGLSEQLGLTADDLSEVFSKLKPDQRLAIVLDTPQDYFPKLFYTLQTHSLTLLSYPLEPGAAHHSTLILHPTLVQSLIQCAVPFAESFPMAPVFGRYNNETAIRLATEKQFHPISCWSSLIKSNFYNAHGITPAGLFTTLHDECHLMVKQLIPEPLRDHFFELGKILQLINCVKKADFQYLFELDFFNLLGLFNLKHLYKADHYKHPLRNVSQEFEVPVEELLLFDRYTHVKLSIHYLIAVYGGAKQQKLLDKVDHFISELEQRLEEGSGLPVG